MSPLLGTAALLLVPLLALFAAPRVDALAGIMLALVTFIGFVIHAYSRRYLDGQPGASTYRAWFVATIASASLLATAGDLRVMALAWTASSLSLHQLLLFFGDRPAAQVAAHKKFLLSRLADVAIYAAVFLLGRAFGTYDLAVLGERAVAMGSLPVAVHAAGYLLVAGVVMRSAQLPFHGWLIQVMEAPTPVSALLHAGVVNIGGFVLIRLALLIGVLPGVQAALVIIGGTTAVLAALVMMTRISIKVALAWSTAAQMGFMLLECGLGAWELALLHLVAHSCYKAHAFLSSGSVVAQHAARQLAASPPAPTLGRWAASLVGGGLMAVSVGWVAWPALADDARAWVAMALLSVALAPLLLRVELRAAWRLNAQLLLSAMAIAALYGGWHMAFAALLPDIATLAAPSPVIVAIALTLLAALVSVQVLASSRPHTPWVRALQVRAFAGFHLDELFTRATFVVWPPKHVRRRAVSTRPAAPAVLRRAA